MVVAIYFHVRRKKLQAFPLTTWEIPMCNFRKIVSSNHQKKKTLKIIWKKIQDTRNFVTINYEEFLKKIMDNDKIYQKAIKFSEMYINILYWFYADELFNFVEINLLESWMKNCSKSNFERRWHMFNLFHLLRITFSFLIITRLLKVNAYTFFNYSMFQPFIKQQDINKSFISINIQRFSI